MHGIGGRTIAEAQERVSYPEFVTWAKYRQRRGSLNSGLRIEHGMAMLASLYVNAHRKEHSAPVDLFDFAPHLDRPEATLEEAMAAWG